MQLDQKLYLSTKFCANRSWSIQIGCRKLEAALEDEISVMNVTIQFCTYWRTKLKVLSIYLLFLALSVWDAVLPIILCLRCVCPTSEYLYNMSFWVTCLSYHKDPWNPIPTKNVIQTLVYCLGWQRLFKW